jgi:4-amino-4-deoxy-L-arabinose transferase-like glycosyltransferase
VGRAHRTEDGGREPGAGPSKSSTPNATSIAAASAATGGRNSRTWAVGVALVLLATALRLAWVLAVPTVPVSDFAMYRESANYLSEFGHLDHGFIYMPGFVVLLAWIKNLGGDLLAQKLLGVGFGGLGAAGLFVVTSQLFESRRVAIVATLAYALWPAGVAMASVVGTDVPAAALLVCALAVLTAWGPRRPWTAALGFGVAMGLAAWVRAVALPLTALSLGYWLARRTRWPAALALTGAAIAATLLVLSPWALRHARESGHPYFTDDHGGLTALIGANPNSEGTYTRALNQMFHDLTGRSVLDEPHHEVDQAAYALAKDWMRFEPAYALGLATKRAERLFDSERYLLYWSIFRPGVLVGARAAWFAARRDTIGAAADVFGAAVAALALAGVVLAAARRRWQALVLVPFQLALVATYVLFFAEPRYRLPIELLALPFAALTLVELGALAAAVARRAWPEARATGGALALAGAVLLAGVLVWPAIVDGGAALRARHRWAVDVWRVDGAARLAKWSAADVRGPSSRVEGGPGGVRLGADDGGRAKTFDVELAGGALPPGTWVLAFNATSFAATTSAATTSAPASSAPAASAPARLRVATAGGAWLADVAVTPGAPLPIVTAVAHAGGPLRLTATVTSAAPATILVSDVRLDREPTPEPRPPGS